MMFDLNRSAKLIGGALLNREETWSSYLPEAGNWQRTALLLTVPLIVLSGLLAYVVGLFAGDSILFGQIRPTLSSSLLTMVSAVFGATVVAFIFGTLSGTFGGKRSFALGLAATTLAFVPGYVGQVLAQLPWIGSILGIALFIYALVCLWKIIPSYLEVPDNRRTGHYVSSLLATVVVMFLFSTTIGRVLMPSSPESGIAAMSNLAPAITAAAVGSETGNASNNIMEKMQRKQELIMAAATDAYEPPSDGRLTEAQILFYLDAKELAHAIRQETERRLDARANEAGNLSMADVMGAMYEENGLLDLNTLDLQMVKDKGGNWAEHMWVQESLFTAARQPDTDDASRANHTLFQKYDDRLSVFIQR